MPTFYERKSGIKPRGQWDNESLREATERIRNGDMTYREAERCYGVPARTIKRRLVSGNLENPGLGPSCSLGRENEERLASLICRLKDSGFTPDGTLIRRLAYQFAVKLRVNHKFSNKKKIAGYDWLKSFLRRHPNLTVKQSQGSSAVKGRHLTKESVQDFYRALESEMKKYNLQNKPQNLFCVDEASIQLISNTVKGVGGGQTDKVMNAENRETVSLVACSSPDGRFLPPALIYNGTEIKREFYDGLPSGSVVYMNPEFDYVNSDIFLKWFKEVFMPHKVPGRNILILPGHFYQVPSIALLELADAEGVSLICLPGHTTHILRPLNKSFSLPFKIQTFKQSEIGPFVSKVWDLAVTIENVIDGFKATGIFPFNKSALPDHLFSVPYVVTDCVKESSEKENPDNPPETEPKPSTSKGFTGEPASLTDYILHQYKD